MGRQDKLIARFSSKPSPKDFAWSELETMLKGFGYKSVSGSGSRIKFINKSLNSGKLINIHKRHPDSTLLEYQIKDVFNVLKEAELL